MHFDATFEYPALAVLFALVAAVFDIRSRRIPNLLVGPALLFGLLLHLGVDGWHGLLHSAEAALAGGGVFLFLYLLGGMGAGDVKLVAAVCAIAGPANVPSILVLTSLTGGLLGLVVALRHGRLRQTLINVVGLTRHHMERGMTQHPEMNVRNAAMLRLPYGVSIATGCLLTLVLRTAGR